MNGARDGCSLLCDGVCDADYGWVVAAGGAGGEGAHALTTDEHGGNVAVGEFFAYSPGVFAPALPGAPVVAPAGAALFGDEWFYSRDYSRDFWVMAQDTDGNPRWAACGGGSYDDAANGVGHDDLGDIYVTGRFGGSADIDCCENNDPFTEPGACEHSLDAMGGSSDFEDVFLAKWSADGRVQWAVSAGSYGSDSGEDVATDSVGRSVVVGYHSGDQEVGARFGEQTLGGHGGKDVFVARYDKNGGLLWVRGSGSSFDDAANAVALDGAGGVYVTGYFAASFVWDDDTTAFDADGVEGRSLFLLGLDAGGDSPWVLTATASNGYGDVEGTGVAVDGQGDVYVTGYFEGGGAVFGDITVATQGGGADLFVAKASGGAWAWVAVASDDGLGDYGDDEVGFGVAVDRSGKAYVTGEFNGHVQFGAFGLDSGCGYSCLPMAPELPSAPYLYGGDGFVAKLSADGQWLWAKRFGGAGTGPTTSRDIGLDPAGRVYTAGGFTGPATFDEVAVDGFNDFAFPAAPSFDTYQDAFVGKLIPDGGQRCFECGDGALDPGEGCDEADGLDHCAGTCDGICFGPANDCGDGWDECDEEYDLGGGAADDGMCVLPSGNLWCFQTAVNAFTYEPVEPGVAAVLGPGVKEGATPGIGGNPTQHPDCPLCAPNDPSVACQAGAAQQWGGDGPPIGTGTTARSVCDGDPATPPCGTNTMGCSATATNDEPAAVECGDYYEFVANTGREVAFEFDELTKTQGPTHWSLWVSVTGADGSFEKVATGPTTQDTAINFGDGIPTPMHVVVLTDYVSAWGPITHQLDVHFRLYAWGATSTDQVWAVDNVYVGEPTHSVELGGLVGEWKGDNDATDAVGANDGAWTGGEAYESSDRCAAFLFDDNASSHVSIGDPATLQLGQVSLSAWFRVDDATLTGLQSIASKWNNVSASQAEYGLVVRDHHVAFAVSTAGDAASYSELAGPAVDAGRWYHAVGTYDGTWQRLYLDGVEVAAVALTGGDIQPSGATMEIGAIREAVDRAAFVGAIDEVMVFSGALDATSVSALYFGQRSLACKPVPTTVWINELHYDNASTDVGEGIELAGPAGMDMSGWTVVAYNGSGGAPYATVTVTGTLADPGDGSGAGYLAVAISGLQNGAPDGIALVDAAGSVVEFLSYEGSMVAIGGAADGMTSVDVGVSETSSTPVGESLQRVGSGCAGGDFTWQAPAAASFGAPNVGQTIFCTAN
ncbi:MAG: hypothetical protein EP329_26730 [Deltaproteobacteria bacterium]|nr:MAG: hypothetical protein EP329_26730 [Deltaproteobacteria bacterium]